MKSRFLLAAAIALPTIVNAPPPLDVNLFARAVNEGRASEPVTDDPALAPVFYAMKKMTGDDGQINVSAVRILKFKQQTKCGRVVFFFEQPSSHTAFKDLGGQLNICEDSLPPWRICTNKPNLLVPSNFVCSDKSKPVDTPEVAESIQNAIKSGSLSQEEFNKSIADQMPSMFSTPEKKGSGK